MFDLSEKQLQDNGKIIQKISVQLNIKSQPEKDFEFIDAARKGDARRVNQLITTNQVTETGYNRALSIAVKEEHIDIVKLLLKSTHITEDFYNLAISFAVKVGNIDILNTLLESSYVNITAYPLALGYAAILGHIDIVEMMLALDCASNIIDYDFAFKCAKEEKNKE